MSIKIMSRVWESDMDSSRKLIMLAMADFAVRTTRMTLLLPAPSEIIGGEATGASAMSQAVAQPIRIPMHGQVESLNAAVAGAVIVFEAARQRRHTRSPRVIANLDAGG